MDFRLEKECEYDKPVNSKTMQILVISPEHDRFYCPVTGVPIFDDESRSGQFEDAESVVAILCSGFFDQATFKSKELEEAWDTYFQGINENKSSLERYPEESVRSFLEDFPNHSWVVFCFDRRSPLGSSRLYYVIDWNLERLIE